MSAAELMALVLGEGVIPAGPAYQHTLVSASPPVSIEQQLRNAVAEGYEVIPEGDCRTVRVCHEGWELVYVSRRAWKTARKVLAEHPAR